MGGSIKAPLQGSWHGVDVTEGFLAEKHTTLHSKPASSAPCAARRGQRGIINQIRTRADKVGGKTNHSARIDTGGTPAPGLFLE